MQSYEPGESWFWDFTRDEAIEGPELAAPHHATSQPVPGPEGAVPADWQAQLS